MKYNRIVEIFVDIFIDGKPSNYMISDAGRVYNKKHDRFLKPQIDNFGYVVVDLSSDNKHKKYKVHRLVAEAFISNPYNKPTVNHEDADKTNNDVTNLTWATYQEQKDHARLFGLIKGAHLGEDHHNCKYSDDKIHQICKLLEEGKLKYKEISLITKVRVNTIKDVKQRRYRTDISDQYKFTDERYTTYSDEFKNSIKDVIRKGITKPKDIIHELNLEYTNANKAIIGRLRKEVENELSSTTSA